MAKAENGTTRRRRSAAMKPTIVPPGNDDAPAGPGEAPDALIEDYFGQIEQAGKKQGAASTDVASLYLAFGKAGGHKAAMRKVQQLAKMDDDKRRQEIRALKRYFTLFSLDDYDQSDIEDGTTTTASQPEPGRTPTAIAAAV